MYRSYSILANKKEIGKIKADNIFEYEISEETNFQLKIDWCYSNIVKVNPSIDGEKIILEAKSNLIGWRIFIYFVYILFKRNQYLYLEIKK